MRKGFQFIKPEDVTTKVVDDVSMTVPDQSLGLRDMMMQFAYIGNEKLSEIVNRGFDGDEDDDLLGVDVGALDFAEVHDRMLDQMAIARAERSARLKPEVKTEPEPAPMEDVQPE